MTAVLLFYLLFPAVIIYLCLRFPLLDRIGMVLLCYAAGLILGNVNILPSDVQPLQNSICEAMVALSLPLLLFSLDLKQWAHLAGKTFLSMILAFLSIIIISSTGFVLLGGVDNWKLVGMAVGVYTGGTPNLAAIKTALNIDPELYLSFHTYDILVFLFCFVFFITIAQKTCHLFLPRFAHRNTSEITTKHSEDINDYRGILRLDIMKKLGLALLLSGGILAVSVGISSLLPTSWNTAATILLITTLGICASFIPAVRNIKKTFQFGMYLIMIFCITVASMASLDQLVNIDIPLLSYVFFCVFGSMALHALLCRFFKIDTDTFIITSASAICSPPFVPLVAAALKNRTIILSGLTTGIIGYAVGNYLGITIAYIVKSIIE